MPEPMGFYTDTTVCIGCKACEVACKQWNQLPSTHGGMEPACTNACPTQSIQFGTISELRERAQKRVDQLHQIGEKRAYLYGADEKMLGGLNSFYLLVDKPEVYRLPPDPKLPTRNLRSGAFFSIFGAILIGVIGILNFRNRRAAARHETRP